MTLDQLGTDEPAVVVALGCQGPGRRRLMDLGLLPGTEIVAAMASPLGDPVAYRVRGSMIALRREQARTVVVMPRPAEEE